MFFISFGTVNFIPFEPIRMESDYESRQEIGADSSKSRSEIGFEGCPITAFIGCMQKSTFMRPENWGDPKAPKAN